MLGVGVNARYSKTLEGVWQRGNGSEGMAASKVTISKMKPLVFRTRSQLYVTVVTAYY